MVTLRKWYVNNSWTLEICEKIERVTNGQVRAVELRPDLLTPRLADEDLAHALIDNYEEQLGSGCLDLTIALMNYFEFQCPTLYEYIVNNMLNTKTGREFMNQRNAHKKYDRN